MFFLMLVLLLGLFSSNQGFAQTWGDYKYSDSDGKITIVKYIGSDVAVRIPAEIEGKPVVAIGEWAFLNNKTLSDVMIPEGIVFIGRSAFYMCSKLSVVTLPKSLKTITCDAFSWCSSLTTFMIPSGVTDVDSSTFNNCGQLESVLVDESNSDYASIDGVLYTKDKRCLFRCPEGKSGSITIPKGVENIWSNSFFSCDRLTDITIPSSVLCVGPTALNKCDQLESIFVEESNADYVSIDGVLYTKDKSTLVRYPGGRSGSFTIPEGVTAIRSFSFNFCNGLIGATIPSSVREIGYSAFNSCSNLINITIAPGVTSIGDWAFCNCSSLSNVTIPSGVTSIGEAAFRSCSSLTNVTIPSGVTNIGKWAFLYCNSLASIVIPSTVTKIGNSAFGNCDQLESIRVEESNADYASIDGVLYTKDKSTLVCYPGGKSGSFTITESVSKIENNAFSDCRNLTGVTIPSGVTEMGYNVFYSTLSLTNIVFLGDAPDVKGNIFLKSAKVVVCVPEDAKGWPTPPDPWHGQPTAYLKAGQF